jgi:hypothetical protein
VLTVDLYDWSLEVSKSHNVVTRLIILRDVYHLVIQTSAVKCLLSGVALNTSWLGVEGDRHFFKLFLLEV